VVVRAELIQRQRINLLRANNVVSRVKETVAGFARSFTLTPATALA
jgi:hypothetical protein